MTTTQVKRHAVVRRPRSVIITAAVQIFLGVTALAGGIELLTGWWVPAAMPAEWLDRLPLIDSWTVPALVLGIGFGIGSLVAAYGMLRRPDWVFLGWLRDLTGYHWSWAATVLLGLGMTAWIALELIYLPEHSWLEALYGTVGAALVILPLLPSARAHLRA